MAVPSSGPTAVDGDGRHAPHHVGRIHAEISVVRIRPALRAGLGLAGARGRAAGGRAGHSGETYTGRGTFYGYDGGGNCSLPFPEHVLTVAINDSDYQGSQACGAYLEVLNPATSKKVVVRVDNRCPDCPPHGLDLAIPALAQIAPIDAGIVSLRWRYVSGPDTPASVVFKEGSSASWSALQVRNQRNAVASLAYRASGSGGTYVPLERQMYNYFLAPGGMGPGPFDLKITDVFGQVLEVSGVPLSVGPELSLGVQFPRCCPQRVRPGPCRIPSLRRPPPARSPMPPVSTATGARAIA